MGPGPDSLLRTLPVLGQQRPDLSIQLFRLLLRFTRFLFLLQGFQLSLGVLGLVGSDVLAILPRHVDAPRPLSHRFQIARQMHVAGQGATNQLLGPRLHLAQIEMDTGFQRPRMALEERLGITLVPLGKQCMWRRRFVFGTKRQRILRLLGTCPGQRRVIR